MREILFRAKRENNGEWVYGYYVRMSDAAGSAELIGEDGDSNEKKALKHIPIMMMRRCAGNFASEKCGESLLLMR